MAFYFSVSSKLSMKISLLFCWYICRFQVKAEMSLNLGQELVFEKFQFNFLFGLKNAVYQNWQNYVTHF